MNATTTAATPTHQHPFLAGGGEMGELTRTYDWSTTSLGSPEQWPLSLRTTLGILLHSAFPMFLFWGDDLTCFYNNAYRPSLGHTGKHPALGKPGASVWPEIWGFIGPLIEQVMATGEPVFFEDQLVPIYRNGQLEDAYWTFSYSPAYGDEGQISGVFVTCTETTSAVVNRKNLEETQRQVLNSFEESPVAIAIIDKESLTFRMANRFYGELVGRSPDQLVGQPLLEALPELRGQGFDQLIQEVITTGIPYIATEVPVSLVRHNQLDTIYVDLTYQPQRKTSRSTDTDSISGVLVVATDVTQQVKARQVIEDSEARFRSLIEEAPVATCLLMGRSMRVTVANDVMLGYWGKDKSVIGKPLVEALPEIEGQPFLGLLEEVFMSGKTYEAKAARADLNVGGVLGTYYFDYTYKPLRNDVGEVYAVMNMAVDVTEQVRNKEALALSETYFRRLTDAVPAIIWTTEPDGYCSYLNKQWYDATGQTKAESEGFGWLDATHPDDTAEAGRLFVDANEKQIPFRLLYRLRQKDGGYRWAIDQGSPRFSDTGEYEGFVGTVVDVHDQTIARQALEESETRFRSLIEEAPVATCLFVGRELIIELANQPMLDFWGKGKAPLGRAMAEVAPELKGQPFLDILDEIFTTGRTHHATAAPCDLEVDGVLSTYYFNFTYKPLFDSSGNVYAIINMAIDVTQQVLARQKTEVSEARYRALSADLDQQVQDRTRQLQASVQDLERSNQNLQQFAYVASHDLQEPLRKIQSFGDLLNEQYGGQLGDGVDYLSRMQLAANRMSVLIKDLLTYSRISTRQEIAAPVPLTQVVTLVLNDLELVIQEAGAVVTVNALPTIVGDKSQLGQLFQNLLSNALKFRRSGVAPELLIACETVNAADLPPTVTPARVAPAYYRIDVADNGIGFDPKYVDRIFQVFQRLHSRSEFAGTGVGLAICEKVAANHGGTITANSQPGQGATFSVYFPV